MIVQKWLNQTYGAVSGFPTVEEDGRTGWKTMFALTRALQVELGITALSDAFGPTTTSRFESQVGTITKDTTQTRVKQILMASLWCKGYYGGDVKTGEYTDDIAATCSNVKRDMGFGASPTPGITVKLMKSLLTMDAYKLVPGGDSSIRAAQQWLNGIYIGRKDFSLVACDGIFARDVQKGLMLAIQYELGMADGVANGTYGPATQSGLKERATVQVGDVDSTRRFVRLFQCALTFNKRPVPLDGQFGAGTKSAVLEFQAFVELPLTGRGDYATWASLLVSTGDPDRPGAACDTNVPLTTLNVSAVKDAGYKVVGRYLNGVTKRIQAPEIELIHDMGLSFFPIFQEYNNDPKYFTEDIGFRHGWSAVLRARQLGIKPGAIIYFSVDFDATAGDIDTLIIPWFEQVRSGVDRAREGEFRVGVYGPRYVCQRVCDAGLAVSSFVGGMSRGWSGNLGYALPTTWAYDQIQGLTLGSGTSSILIDKNVLSPRAEPLSANDVLPTPIVSKVEGGVGVRVADELFWQLTELSYLAEVAVEHTVTELLLRPYRHDLVLHYLQRDRYWGPDWKGVTPLPEYMNSELLELGSARSNFLELASPTPPNALYEGDLAHFAATTRAYLMWGEGVPHDTVNLGDLSGWGLDLATFWAQYVVARNAGELDLEQYLAERLCTSVESLFSREDLVADIDAYLAYRRLGDRDVSDVIREILVECDADPTWRYRHFWEDRFGSDRDALHGAMRHIFDAVPLSLATYWKMDFQRPPGEPDHQALVPQDELDREFGLLADAFERVVRGLDV
ncbi:hypothetical protein Cch01nite_26910 [Cellulomonas chitinilytica]|uniref:DUF1906 domain-containing protein n=2 Tax=Cellulomonas chitinilytica TaxID=398759 RepID=A0A919U2Z8_9CELL|nr:hypothetical protein Cch01nite_26910 [Cellulomonas chitinilytica]